MNKKTISPAERRSFLTRFNAGAASLAALAFGGVALAQTKSAPAAPFQPERHAQDDWMDQVPGKHRMVIDTTNYAAFSDATLFGGNFIIANGDYGLQAKDVAVMIIARHQSTGLAYSNEMWAKYGATLAGDLPEAQKKETPTANPSMRTIDNLTKQGVQFAVCSMATRRISGLIARATGGNADDIFKELTSHLVPNAHMAAAGILAVSRAQERGYTLVTA